ncbi:hypothetical protein [Actinokineospora sp. UTMC 2448]|uniref:hypothetical protein n=1 Tax=Actinokineospora sp. UTMC 2448 TaxID=2268449 RepID=UPI00216438D7|nr:hypothetical protein [Actinokineospora sp. UTMC 2448]
MPDLSPHLLKADMTASLRTQHPGRWVFGLLLVAMLSTVGISVLSAGDRVDPAARPGPSSATRTTDRTPAPTLTLAEFRAKEKAAHRAVRTAVERVLKASSLAEVDTATANLSKVLDEQWNEIASFHPSDEVWEPTRHLLAALHEPLAELRGTKPSSNVASTDECGPTTLQERLYDAKANVYQILRSSEPRLPLPASPEPPPAGQNRLPNGHVIERTGPRGPGRLDIDNGTADDVAVSVVTGDPSKPQVMVYVRAHSQATVTGISGTYQVYFKSGSDWDADRRGFTQGCAFHRFDQPFDQRSHWQIDLRRSVLGNAKTSTVPPY